MSWTWKVDGYEVECRQVTKPQVFDPPKMMLVNTRGKLVMKKVYAILAPTERANFPVVCDDDHYAICCEIPKPRRATHRELSEWCAKGNGQWKQSGDTYWSAYNYDANIKEDEPIRDDTMIRKWGTSEWIEPDAIAMGLPNPYGGRAIRESDT
jgi:hypothetical protein